MLTFDLNHAQHTLTETEQNLEIARVQLDTETHNRYLNGKSSQAINCTKQSVESSDTGRQLLGTEPRTHCHNIAQDIITTTAVNQLHSLNTLTQPALATYC